MRKMVTEEAIICEECGNRLLTEVPTTCDEPGCDKEMHNGCAFWVSVKSHHKTVKMPNGDPLHLVKIFCLEHAQPSIQSLKTKGG